MFFSLFYSLASAMDIVERIHKVMECPCCFEFPKTGPRNEIGLCENGHVTCFRCFEQVMRTQKECPSCRNKNFCLSTSHYAVNGIFTILSAVAKYSCSHQGCSIQIVGPSIVEHETNCSFKPLKCPKLGCKESVPLFSFMDKQHSCMELIYPHPFQQQHWHMVIQMDEMFSINTFRIAISKHYRPKLLVTDGTLPSEHLYVNIAPFNSENVVIYLNSLNPRKDTPQPGQQVMFHLKAFIYTHMGKVGYSNISPIHFPNETLRNASDGVCLHYNTLIEWLRWIKDFTCAKCPNHQPLHMHIVVSKVVENIK